VTVEGRVADPAQYSPGAETSAQKLIEKLARSGQLRASYLIRVLREGHLELFDHGLATLLDVELEPMRKALYGASPHAVALACRAAGIDSAAFLTVFQLCRHHKQVVAALSDEDRLEIQTIFAQVPKGDALQRLRAAAA